MAHLPSYKTEITLRNLKGASWTVNSVPTTKVHTTHTFCGGWLAFVRSNEINAGDICIFELVRKYELRVYILRVGKEDSRNQNGKVHLTKSNVGSDITSCKKNGNLPKKNLKNSLPAHSQRTKIVKRSDSEEVTTDVNATGSSDDVTICALPNAGSGKPGKVFSSVF